MTYKLVIIMCLMTAYHFQDIKEESIKELLDKEQPDDDFKIGDLSKEDFDEIAKLTSYQARSPVKSNAEILGLVKYGGCKYYCSICKCGYNFHCLIKNIYCLLNKLRSILMCLTGLSCSQKRNILMYTLNNYLWGCNKYLATVLRGIFWNIISKWC